MKICPMCGASYDDASVFCSVDGAALRSLADGNDLIHTVIADRYLITQQLGEGGMGRVYLAKHVRLPQKWAIKVLNPALVRDSGALTRFNQEAASASRIENRHVARVIDFGETSDGLLYLAMEYVDGEPLSKLIEREGALDAARVADITAQVAEALTAAHDLSIVHRDLKPDNIMVGRDRDGVDDVKVVDFGIAKAINQSEGEKVTKTGFAIGTPEYMSPEQIRAGQVDGRSDIYSLALVAFRMLTGKLPFPADTPQESMFMRVTHAPRTLGEMYADVEWPLPVQGVFDRALARAPEDRFQSAADFAQALRGAVQEWRSSGGGESSRTQRAGDVPGVKRAPSAGTASAGTASAASPSTGPAAPVPSVANAYRALEAHAPSAPSALGAPAPHAPAAASATPLSRDQERARATDAATPPGAGERKDAPRPGATGRRSPALARGVAALAIVVLVGLGGYYFTRFSGVASDAGVGRADERGAGNPTPSVLGDTLGDSLPQLASADPSSPGAGSADAGAAVTGTAGQAPVPPSAGVERSESATGARDMDGASRDRLRASAGREERSASPSSPPAHDPASESGSAVSSTGERGVRARRELEALQLVIEDLSEGGARKVLAAIPDALPKLATRADTVEAWYYGLQAELILGDVQAACGVIGRIGRDASSTPFAAPVQVFSDSLRCK